MMLGAVKLRLDRPPRKIRNECSHIRLTTDLTGRLLHRTTLQCAMQSRTRRILLWRGLPSPFTPLRRAAGRTPSVPRRLWRAPAFRTQRPAARAITAALDPLMLVTMGAGQLLVCPLAVVRCPIHKDRTPHRRDPAALAGADRAQPGGRILPGRSRLSDPSW